MARVWIRVNPGAQHESIEVMGDGTLKVSVTAPPLEGKANDAVCELLAEKLSLRKSDVKIVAGKTSKLKQVELPLSLEEIQKRLNRPPEGVW
ncbi:MAG: hypothetical protein XD58_0400 [Thermotoga sp. 50_1627]|uniref:DUF167 domain-containing protein n=1 Tax=Pseudothermotoga sp. TaxID=2033661 RepID=UPI00076BF617|nr:MAG: hypothetical protein XD45_0207 [Thermotoga sp. 50_64]KUK25532.1 MAG: hypothetical protein XD58_0400 [Thermotoga sp. 50_1627]MBC7116557.1 DUF167 domain-containing protein [Pseudothermotoga sp.]MDK2922568.1 uncharacterized protein [Pseudothermotoga sp.]